MKKRIGSIPIVLFALLLAGCDAMLEGIYPDQTDPRGRNSIELRIEAVPEIVSFWSMEEVWVALEKDGTYFGSTHERLDWDFGSGSFIAEARFGFLDDGSYEASVWLDDNGNRERDPGEPSGSFGPITLPHEGDRSYSTRVRLSLP